jgi:tetratricopeptide (TPR) repeat protein
MRHNEKEPKSSIKQILSEYEVMSQKGTASFHEETVFIQMIDLLEEEGKWQRALKMSDAAISQHPFSADLFIRKAELLLNRNMIDECLVTIGKAEVFAPANIHLLLLKADLISAKGNHEDALSIIEAAKSIATFEDVSEVFLTEAHIYEDMHNFREMYQSLSRCLQADPNHTEGYDTMLKLVLRKAYFKDSIGLHNKLIDENAYNWQAWRNLGFALRGVHKIDEAIEAFEFAFAIEDSCKIAYMEAAEMLIEKEQYLRALYIYENAIFNTHEDAEIMKQLGYCYEKLKEYKTAQVFYERSLEYDAEYEDSFYRMGECAILQGQWQKAVDYFKKAIKLNPHREEFHAGLAEAYFHTDQLSKALFSYRKAAYIAPDDITYWMRYAYFLINIGQEKMALRVLLQAEMYCGGPEIEYCRVACLYQMGKQSEALYLLGEALQCDYDTHKTLFRWRPELAKNEEMQRVIMAFLP